MGILILLLHLTFGVGCGVAITGIAAPQVIERVIFAQSRASGLDPTVVVTDRAAYRRRLRWTGALLLILLLPAWMIVGITFTAIWAIG